MNGFLIQLKGEGIEELYWSSIEIEEEIINIGYTNWMSTFDDSLFEDWWNTQNPDIQIERVFVTEIYI